MALSGRWRLTATDSLDDLQKKIGTSQEHIAKSVALVQLDEKLAPVEELTIEGDKTARQKLILAGETFSDKTVTIGVESDGEAMDGRPVKYFITKESDSKMIRTEKGDGYELKYVREVVGDVMTLTITGTDNINCVRKYKRL